MVSGHHPLWNQFVSQELFHDSRYLVYARSTTMFAAAGIQPIPCSANVTETVAKACAQSLSHLCSGKLNTFLTIVELYLQNIRGLTMYSYNYMNHIYPICLTYIKLFTYENNNSSYIQQKLNCFLAPVACSRSTGEPRKFLHSAALRIGS